MKKITWVCSLILFLVAFSGYSQFLTGMNQEKQSGFKSIEIAFTKTTSIVFPYAIKSIDRGSPDILVQKAKGVENVLFIKAGVQHFRQTNLTVVTADGRLYGFIVNYDEQCPVLNVKTEDEQGSDREILFSLENENQKKIELYSRLALYKKKKVDGLSRTRYQIRLQVNGISVNQDIMFFRLLLENRSKINYDVDQLRFFIRDQKKAVRTASQELEMEPVYVTSKISQVADLSELSAVFALPKFTIPEKKILVIQLIEKHGGRHLELTIKNNDLVNLDVLAGL